MCMVTARLGKQITIFRQNSFCLCVYVQWSPHLYACVSNWPYLTVSILKSPFDNLCINLSSTHDSMSDHKVTHVYVKRIESTLSIKPVLKMHVHVVHVLFQHTIEKLFRKNK